jgi:hypothetical protein
VIALIERQHVETRDVARGVRREALEQSAVTEVHDNFLAHVVLSSRSLALQAGMRLPFWNWAKYRSNG